VLENSQNFNGIIKLCMKIGIDARLYGTKHAGIGRYTEQVIKNLEKIDSQNQYFVFLQKDGFDSYQPQAPNFKKVLADFEVYGFGEQLGYPSLLKKYNLDFVHFTHFNVPLFFKGKFVVTIHDLIISHYPSTRATTLNPILYFIKLFFYRLVIRATAKKARKIIAVSEFTKTDIVRLLKVNPDKIEVIYEGVDFAIKEANNCDDVLAKYGINNEFLLYVGSAYPHKNLESLVSAFKEVLKSKPEMQLVLVGRINYFYERLRVFINYNCDPAVKKKIILTGYADDEDLSCLYKKATVYVFPSLIEGFGLPPLEAQNYNLPVASSNATCLPEILNDSAVYFEPTDINKMATTIISLLNNTQLQEELKAKGTNNLRRFSWQDSAKDIFSLYSKI
ncbi:MAG: glycosyltransferase family 1 protein, partial [Candidatus Buchananbacteria bacterium]